MLDDNRHVWTTPSTTAPPQPFLERLTGLEPPLQVLVGEADDPDNLAAAVVLVERVPAAALTIVPGAGHLIELEQPAVVLAALATRDVPPA